MYTCVNLTHPIGYNGLRETGGNNSLSLAEQQAWDWRAHQAAAQLRELESFRVFMSGPGAGYVLREEQSEGRQLVRDAAGNGA